MTLAPAEAGLEEQPTVRNEQLRHPAGALGLRKAVTEQARSEIASGSTPLEPRKTLF